MQKYLPVPLVLMTFIFAFVVSYSLCLPILQDYDMGWHIAAGDLIRSSGALPKHDSWSFSGSEQIWYNVSWLWDVILSFVHEKTGLQGLFVFTSALPAMLVALLVASLHSRGSFGVNAQIFVAMITAYAMFEFATGRPQVIGMFLALAFHHILHHSRSNPTTWKLFLLPLLMVLWLNLHGSFFVGFIIIGAYGLEAIYTIIKTHTDSINFAHCKQYLNHFINSEKKWFWRLFYVGLACLAAIPLNPYGFGIINDVLVRTSSSVVTKYIMEWQPFVFGSVMGASLWFVAIVFFGNMRVSNVPVADKILAVVWLVLMLLSVRYVGFLSILGAPYLAANLPADDLKDENTRKLLVWINNLNYSRVILALIPIIVISSYFLLPVLGKEHYVEKAEKSPLPAISFVMENYAGKRVLNDYDFGGRIIYESKGKFPVFMDGRAVTVYNEKILSDFMAFVTLEKDWQKTLEPYQIDVILLAKGRDFVKDYEKGLYNDQWQEVYSDKVASVYVRKN
ncbi:MAG: hypothetical protein ABL867_07995 [Rickettsiales bacterium]